MNPTPQFEQIKKMHNLITPRDPQLMLFLYFICYTLARPKELLHLKVAHLRPDVARVLLVGEHAKTDVEKRQPATPARNPWALITSTSVFESTWRSSGLSASIRAIRCTASNTAGP